MTLIDALESRTLLSGNHPHFGGGHHLRIPQPPSDAVTADLAKIDTDRQQLDADRTALAATLKADRQAIRDAIAALDAQLTPLKQTLADDAASWRATIKADLQALRNDRRDGLDTTADKAKLKADSQAARAALKADAQAIADVINNDAGVQAAKQKLTDDRKPIDDDLAVLAADYKQLKLDIKAQRYGTT